MTTPPSFNLCTAPWITVRLRNGAVTTLSLRDAFARTDDVREIVGELPTQVFAITRLMLAILYRASREYPLTERTVIQWHQDGVPVTAVDRYLDEHHDRFDLFHPTRPFMQVPDLTLGNAKLQTENATDVTPIILDLPTRKRLFTTRGGTGATYLTFAEAARWLLNAHAFDVSGIKSGALGDSRVKAGKGYPIGVAWSGLLGGIMAQGSSLHETLLLSLVPTDTLAAITSGSPAHGGTDIPPWEESEADTAAEREGLLPTGPVRLYTWQSRRIRLFTSNDRVVGCIIANGDRLTPQNMHRYEPMSAWRFSEPQTKAAKQTTYMPRTHQAGRSLWRGIGALLPHQIRKVPKRDEDAWIPPAFMTWLETLYGHAAIDSSALLKLRSVGVIYGSNDSVVDDVFSDEIMVPLVLLRERNRALASQAERAVELADEGVFALRRLAENLDRAAGGEGEGARARAGDIAYAALDIPYRSWLRGIADDANPLDVIDEWKSTARDILRNLGNDVIAASGPTAWVGREVTHRGNTELVNTPRAETWFLRALHQTFGSISRKEDAA